ncbi:MFS general substrate transporter [Glonium stellatum]|uniref:MFS general substrate transporter n=1 Tax=Glonium stellatum TaxID=574774 RepID=A0A8E2F8S9_9PEZI|nr:MFS general substrate transporter [Glonium stellatum]
MSTQSGNDRSNSDIEAAEDRRPNQQTELGRDLGLTLTTIRSAAVSATTLDTSDLSGHPNEKTLTGDTSPSSPFSKYVPSTQSGSGAPSISAASSPPSKEIAGSAAGFSKLHEIAFIANVCFAQLFCLAALAQTVAPLPIIAAYFNNENPGQMSWYTASFSLTVGTFILPAGRLGDMYGHKRVFQLGWAWFALWSLVAGFSHSSVMLSACRALQGIGPALLVPNAMALVGRTFPMGMKRNIVFSLFGAAGPTGFVLGAVFSSICAQLGSEVLPPVGWAWSFWFLALVCMVLCLATYFIIPDEPQSTPSTFSQPPTFDFLGCFTGVSGLILVNFAWNQAPLVGWSQPYIYSLLIVGLISLAGFLYVELHVATHPLVPLRGLQKEAGFTLACIAAGWGSHGIWIYYLYLFLEQLRGHTALSACAQTFPVAITGTCAALSVGFLLKKIKVAYVMMLAMIFFTVGTLLIATAPVSQTYWAQTFLSVILMPGGMNLSFPAGTILLSNALPREHQGIAASLISTMVNYSISTGLGIAGTIERNVNPNGDDLITGFRGGWYFGIGLSGLGLLISMWFVYKSRT